MSLRQGLAAGAAMLFCLTGSGAAMAQQSETKIGAWRYLESHVAGMPAFRAMAVGAANPKAALAFQCSQPAPVSIVALVTPGEPLGVPGDGALKKGLTYQVDSNAPITRDWFYPDETKGETDVTKTIGVDSFEVLNAVRKGQKTVRVRATKADGGTVELSFDIAGAEAALSRLVADCKSAVYR